MYEPKLHMIEICKGCVLFNNCNKTCDEYIKFIVSIINECFYQPCPYCGIVPTIPEVLQAPYAANILKIFLNCCDLSVYIDCDTGAVVVTNISGFQTIRFSKNESMSIDKFFEQYDIKDLFL